MRKKRTDKPISKVEHITLHNCRCDCYTFFNVTKDEKQYILSDFTLKSVDVTEQEKSCGFDAVDNIIFENVVIK